MAFFDAFLDASPTRPFTATLISVQMKGVEVVHIWTKFNLQGTCNSGVLFQAASGWFYGHNPPKYGLIGFKLLPVIQGHLVHQMIEGFYNILNKWSKLGQKTEFLSNF